MLRPDLIPSRGAVAEPLVMEVVRELTPTDLALLVDAPKVNVPVLQKLRATHHRQAQLLAQGKRPTEVAAIVGCTVQRLVQLQQDPTFTQLVSYYHDQNMTSLMEDSVRLKDKLIDVGEMAVDELRLRLEDEKTRTAMKTFDVRQIAEMAMDRTVAPPKTATPATSPPAAITINFGTQVGPRPIAEIPPGAPTIDGTAEEGE